MLLVYEKCKNIEQEKEKMMIGRYNMNATEILFKLSNVFNEEEIFFDNALGENLFGKTISNRVESIVYQNLCKMKNVSFDRFEKCFELLCMEKKRETEDYKKAIEHVAEIFNEAEFNYAFLKGAFLITNLYEEGFRQSNDIDVLIEEKDIDKCQALLFRNGFVQGYFQNGEIKPATRSEVIISRMNYGETIPFCKVWNNHPVFVDINFSLDYKPMEDNKIIHNMLETTKLHSLKTTFLRTLNLSDFISHLCLHLYKEATTYDWVRRRKDLNLYKFSDINVIFHEKVTNDIFQELAEKIRDYGVIKECYYALLYAAEIYNNLTDMPEYAILLEKIKPDSLDYLHQIIDPMRKKIYSYDMSFKEWFACEDRVSYLKEV